MGLEKIYQMTSQKSYSLKIYMESPDGDKGEVRFSNFNLTEDVRVLISIG